MRKPRRVETGEERSERMAREAQAKRDDIVADDEAIDRAIRRNIQLHGP